MTTMRDLAEKILPKEAVYDYAYPIDWAKEVEKRNGGLFPRGLVWLYDAVTPLSGRPFPLTMYGYWAVKIAYPDWAFCPYISTEEYK